MEDTRREELPARRLWLVPVLLALLFNFNVLQNGYGWDDELIIQNQGNSVNWFHSFLPAGGKSDKAYYRPLVGLSYHLDHWIWGKEPFGFHLSVWLSHAINTALVFWIATILSEFARRPYPLLPLAAASLFAVHPAHAEPVAWIAGRNDVLYTTFLLASFLFYAHNHRTRKTALFVSSMAFFFLGLLTKEAAVGFLLIYPVFDYLVRDRDPAPGRPWKDIVIGWTGPAVLVGIYFWMRAARLSSPLGHASTVSSVHTHFVWDALIGFGYYMKTMLIPYPHNPFVAALPDSPVFTAFSVFAAVGIAAGMWFSLYRRKVILGIGIAWCVFLAAPAVAATVLNVAATPVAERYVYGPSAGFLLALCWIVFAGLEKIQASGRAVFPVGKAAAVVWIGAVVVFGLQSWNRNTGWKDHLRFWRTAVAASPEAAFPHRNLGIHLAKLQQYDEAEPHLKAAVELYEKETGPDSMALADSLHYLAQLYQKKGNLDQARPLYRRSLDIRAAHDQESPLMASTLHNLGALYRETGQKEEAERYFQRAVDVRRRVLGASHPDLAASLNELGLLCFGMGEYSKAVPPLEEALHIREGRFGARHKDTASSLNSLAMVYGALGRSSEADRLFQRSVAIYEELGNEEAALAQVLGNYAGLFFAEGNLSKAEAQLRRSIELEEQAAGPNSPALANSLENYAALLYRLDRKEEAEKAVRRAETIRSQQR